MSAGRREVLAAAALALLAGCTTAGSGPGAGPTATQPVAPTGSPSPTGRPATPTPTPTPEPTRGTPEEIASRAVVPVLCFHQLREHTSGDGAYARSIITPPGVLATQLGALRDAGYESVSGTALVDYLEYGAPALPAKPVLLTFDDGHITHYSVGLPTLRQMGWVGTFFPMTVVLNKTGWLSDDHLREMAAAGMTIGAHTWDHQRLDRLPPEAWGTQLSEPRVALSEVIGTEVDLFAYPYGLWTQDALTQVGAAGYRAAFQLAGPLDAARPLLTIRRIMPPPTRDGATLLARMESDFSVGVPLLA